METFTVGNQSLWAVFIDRMETFFNWKKFKKAYEANGRS
jgi:hypothetical protein